jgi:hypothetical protein
MPDTACNRKSLARPIANLQLQCSCSRAYHAYQV